MESLYRKKVEAGELLMKERKGLFLDQDVFLGWRGGKSMVFTLQIASSCCGAWRGHSDRLPCLSGWENFRLVDWNYVSGKGWNSKRWGIKSRLDVMGFSTSDRIWSLGFSLWQLFSTLKWYLNFSLICNYFISEKDKCIF